METGVFEIELLNGAKYRILYNNRSQKNRAIKAYHKIMNECKSVKEILNGLHSVAQFEKMVKIKALAD